MKKSPQQTERELAESFGWKAEKPDTQRGEGWFFYEKGNYIVWICTRGWAKAKLVKGHYTEHQYFRKLEEALK